MQAAPLCTGMEIGGFDKFDGTVEADETKTSSRMAHLKEPTESRNKAGDAVANHRQATCQRPASGS